MAGKQLDVGSGTMDALGRYYTRAEIGRVLVGQMEGLAPRVVLDLGAGDGSLVRAAAERWITANLLTVDIDAAAKEGLNRALSRDMTFRQHNHIRADALSPRVSRLIELHRDSIDAAVCNPPFVVPRWKKNFKAIIQEAGFSASLAAIPEMDAALLFLAQNLRLSSPGATLGMILPDSLISAKKYRPFREELLEKHRISKVIRLPRGSFESTDAQAYVLVVEKNRAPAKRIGLQELSQEGNLSAEVVIGLGEGHERLDFNYHREKHRNKAHASSLRGIGAEILRGRLSSSQLKESAYPVLHTTDLDAALRGHWCDFSDFGLQPRMSRICACPGDILVARVGRNLETKVVGVARGYPEVSDCLYVLRVPSKFRERLLAYLSSPAGGKALSSLAYGVSARQLAKSDLDTLEVPF